MSRFQNDPERWRIHRPRRPGFVIALALAAGLSVVLALAVWVLGFV